MMKVLVVQNISGIAGSENYFLALLPALKEYGIQCSFLNIYRKQDAEIAGKFSQLLTERNIEVFEHRVSSWKSASPVWAIKKIWKKEGFDLVHSHLIYADFWTALAKLLTGNRMKFISTLHGYQENLYVKYCLNPVQLPRTFYYFLARFALGKANGIFACSEGLRNFYEQSGILPREKAEVILHGFTYPAPKEKYPLKGNPSIAIAGRVIERKGHHFVINILPELIEKNPGLHLTIIGTGNAEPDIQSQVKTAGLSEFVSFTGFQPDVRKYLANADLVVVPSYAEGLPLVIFEAFSLSRPVVAFDTIGCNEAIEHGVNGMLAKPFEQQDLRIKMEELLSKPELADKTGRAAKHTLETKFSEKRMVEETAVFFRRYLAK